MAHAASNDRENALEHQGAWLRRSESQRAKKRSNQGPPAKSFWKASITRRWCFRGRLHVAEAVRAAEDLAMRDYIVGWTQGPCDHINKFWRSH
jgi:hypothetical protein